MSLLRYPEYKDSGVAWLGDAPAHWLVKRIRVVAELNPSKSEISELRRESEVTFLPMEAIGDDGSLNLDRTRPIAEVENGYTYEPLAKGALRGGFFAAGGKGGGSGRPFLA